jgi:methylenetetrahydrofolate dehydrogenase (NADP+)/methenyltetrahydrofolate cyclohydrolase
VGNDPASETYVGHKVRACKVAGFESTLLRYDANITEADLLKRIGVLAQSESVDGILVQLPLPAHINENRVLEAIPFEKDVDGFHPTNAGLVMQGRPHLVAATPAGIMELLRHYNVETAGKHAVVVGRSNIVGTPVSVLLSRNAAPGNCTVTLCHSRTPHLSNFTRQADILVVAAGKPHLVGASDVKPGAVVIDVGIHRMEDASRKQGFRLVGDVKFDEVAPLASAITPVPGGVGPMTIAALLQNTYKAYQTRQSLHNDSK